MRAQLPKDVGLTWSSELSPRLSALLFVPFPLTFFFRLSCRQHSCNTCILISDSSLDLKILIFLLHILLNQEPSSVIVMLLPSSVYLLSVDVYKNNSSDFSNLRPEQ